MEQKMLCMEFMGDMEMLGDLLRTITKALGLNVVSQVVSATGKEADFALTDSIRVAMRLRAETEATRILIAFTPETEAGVEALAGRFPDRMEAVQLIDFEPDRPFLVSRLIEIAGTSSKKEDGE